MFHDIPEESIALQSNLETWHHKYASQKKQNDTLNGVAIATLSAPVSFCPKKQISPFATPEMRQRVLLGTDTVPIYCLNSLQ